MPKINQEEYEKIKLLPDYDWNWIAREKTGKILSFTNKPAKTDEVWKDKQTRLWFNYKDSQLFQFIQWEDEEPYNIAELIEEYEYSTEHVSHVVNERVKALGKAWSESEETEVKKDKKWLEDEVDKVVGEYQSENIFANFTRYMIYDIKDVINQLDEPEVLSQELPVIPKFVADWIEKCKEKNKTLSQVYSDLKMSEVNVIKWLYHEGDRSEKGDLLARAWLDGFTVEEEQKYYVLDKEDAALLKKSATGEGVAKSVGTNIYNVKSWKDEEKYQLTEQEIKDYDERYWPFAVKVEELEE